MNANIIHRDEIRVVRPEIHAFIGIVDGKAERLGKFGESANVAPIVEKPRESLLEVVVAGRHVEDGFIGLQHLARPGERLAA